MGAQPRTYFELAKPADAAPPVVDFGTGAKKTP